MNLRTTLALLALPALIPVVLPSSRLAAQATPPQGSFGYSDFSAEARLEEKFMAVPDPKLAGEELKTLTLEPHLAATPEDRKTAEYVARQVSRRRVPDRDRSLSRSAQSAQSRAR